MLTVSVQMPDGEMWHVLKKDVGLISRPIKYFKELENCLDEKFAIMWDGNNFLWCTSSKLCDDKNSIVYFYRPSKEEVLDEIYKRSPYLSNMFSMIINDMEKLYKKREKRFENINS